MTRTQRDLCPGCTCTWPYGALVAHDSDCPFMEQFKSKTTQRDHDSALLESYCGVQLNPPYVQAVAGEQCDKCAAMSSSEFGGQCSYCKRDIPKREIPPLDQGLVTFFYLLMRDDIVPGKVASIVQEVEATPANEPIIFTNKHLEAYAREVVNRLKAK